MSDAPETVKSLCQHLRRMSDKAYEQIDADRLSRAADLLDLPPTHAQIMADERVRELVEALDKAMSRTDPAHDIYAWRGGAASALAQIKEPKP